MIKPSLFRKSIYWQDNTGIDKSGFYGILSIYHKFLGAIFFPFILNKSVYWACFPESIVIIKFQGQLNLKING